MVTERSLIKFSIVEYEEEIYFDILHMEASHLSLEGPRNLIEVLSMMEEKKYLFSCQKWGEVLNPFRNIPANGQTGCQISLLSCKAFEYDGEGSMCPDDYGRNQEGNKQIPEKVSSLLDRIRAQLQMNYLLVCLHSTTSNIRLTLFQVLCILTCLIIERHLRQVDELTKQGLIRESKSLHCSCNFSSQERWTGVVHPSLPHYRMPPKTS